LTEGNHTIQWRYYEGGGTGISIFNYYYLTQGGLNSGAYTNGEERLVDSDDITVPAGTPAGTKYCRRILWNPKNSQNTGDPFYGTAGMGAPACATVAADYDLNPVVTPSSGTAQDGDTVTFTYTVQNNGSDSSPAATCYNTDGPGAPIGTSFTCSSPQVFAGAPNPAVTVGTESFTVSNQAPGTTICRILYISPASPSVPSRASQQACVTVAKTLYVRFGGNDVWAGGGFPSVNPACNTSAKIVTVGRALGGTVPTQYAGSSVEYSAFALNKITSFGSAGRVLIGSGAVGALARSLTFANSEGDATRLGYYGAASHCMQDNSSKYGGLAPTAPASLPLVDANVSGAWLVNGSYTFSGSRQMPPGSQKVYYINGDVTIAGNLFYPAPYNSINDIPSLLIIATGNIYVNTGVTRLDGQYVARGTFYTCYPKVEPATTLTCNSLLTVNGAVSANQLDLFRTYGADGATVSSRQAPAELFNFSPELYLVNVLNSSSQTYVQVVNTIELPPRF
jgi:hypothetical protein